jgi:hypothetical protein
MEERAGVATSRGKLCASDSSQRQLPTEREERERSDEDWDLESRCASGPASRLLNRGGPFLSRAASFDNEDLDDEFVCVTTNHDWWLVSNAEGVAVERALRGDYHLLPARRHNMSKNKIRTSFSVVDLIDSKREREDKKTARMSAFAVAKVVESSHLDRCGVCTCFLPGSLSVSVLFPPSPHPSSSSIPPQTGTLVM